MEMTSGEVDLGFVPQRFPQGTHMCLIFKDEDERRRLIARYLESGLAAGEKVSYFAMRQTPEEFLRTLQDAGVDLDAVGPAGSEFEILDATDTYCPGDRFEPEVMLDTLRTFYTTSRDGGFHACRVSGEMSWALEPIPGTDRIMEYEAKVNNVVETHPVTAICQYDARLFDEETILDCLRVHPFMIVNGQVIENPYYMKPEEFLAQHR